MINNVYEMLYVFLILTLVSCSSNKTFEIEMETVKNELERNSKN